MATKKKAAEEDAGTGREPGGLRLKAPDGAGPVGTEDGVIEIVDGHLELPDTQAGRTLARQLCLHAGFEMVTQ